MKKKIVLCIILLFTTCTIWFIFFHKPDLSDNLKRIVVSPNEKYEVRVYYWNSGALDAGTITAELINKKTNKSKEIYNKYRDDENIKVIWLSNEKVKIGKQILDISKGETYNWKDD